MLPHWKKQEKRQRPAHTAGRQLRIERCEDRRMLSGDGFDATIDLFGDQLTDITDGGFFYFLDQGRDSEQVIAAEIRAFDDSLGSSLFIVADLDTDDSFVAPNSWGRNSNGLDFAPIAMSDSDEALEKFLPKPEIDRIFLVVPVMADSDIPAGDVISLAGLFDTNQQTYDTELLAIRSALLASHFDRSLPTEAGDVQPTAPVVLQEAESESTWDRAWSFELASFSPRTPLTYPNVAEETATVPEPVTHGVREESPLSLLPTNDSLGSRFNKDEEIRPVKGQDKDTDIHAEALAELDQVALSSSAWGLAVDRRGGLAVTVIALLAFQRVWNATSSSDSEEKEEPQRRKICRRCL